MKKMIAILMCAACAACGGGDPEDDEPQVDNRPPACQKSPELCT